MTGSIFQAYNTVKNFFTHLGHNREEEDREENRVNGGPNHVEVNSHGTRGFKLFSVGGENFSSRKRPARVIHHEIELELTDDEDEFSSNARNNYFQSWSGYRRTSNLPKRFKASNCDGEDQLDQINSMPRNEKVVTRASGVCPSIPGLKKQPWEFSFPSRNKSKEKNSTQNNICVPASTQNEIPETTEGSANPTASSSHSSGNKTDFSSFRFSQPSKDTTDNKNQEIEVITINDDAASAVSPGKTSSFRQSAYFSKRRSEDVEIVSIRKSISKPKTSFLSRLNNVGRKAVDPISTTIRLEERNLYRDLIEKMNAIKEPFFRGRGPHLQRSILGNSEVKAIYQNWPNASPKVSLFTKYTSPSSSKQGQSISDRVKNDLRLFSTPTASRSSGSTPIGPTSPPVLIDLEEEEKYKGQRSNYFKSPSNPADLSLSASFADLNDALSSTRYEPKSGSLTPEDEDRTAVALVNGQQEEQVDDDISILSESILNKYRTRRINSLALEQNLSPCTNRSWLDGLTTSWRDNQKKRDQEIKEHLETVDVLNKESTLEKDLREDIRRKLRLTEIIVLEEPPPKLPEIDDNMKIIIDTAKRPGREDDILAKVFNIDFTRGDVKTLAPCKWLNDNVINAYLELVAQRSKDEDSGLPKVHVFTTFFYPKLLKEGYSNPLKRWTRKVDLFEHDLLIFPIHLGLHWCMACADLRQKTVKYYDSLGGKNHKCLNALLNYLALEMKERKGQFLNKDEWTLENMEDVPQQQNGSDCGVFTCKFGEYLSRDAELTFVQENMNYFRDRMIYEIIEKDLLFP